MTREEITAEEQFIVRVIRGGDVIQKFFRDQTYAENVFRAIVRAERAARPDYRVSTDMTREDGLRVWATSAVVVQMGRILIPD